VKVHTILTSIVDAGKLHALTGPIEMIEIILFHKFVHPNI
jgi:hypothetical protein